MKKIVIAAANGYLGKTLVNYFADSDYAITCLCRKPVVFENAKCVVWDGKTLGDWTSELEGATALINLAGKSVDCRYTDENKRQIIASRVDSTKVLGEAIANCKQAPRVWLNASSATIYRHSEDMSMGEGGEIGEGFSVEVCKQWEETFFCADTPNTRKAALRIAFVLGNSGGALPMLSRLTKIGLGGKMGKGTQYISWIHELDFCRAVEWLIDNPITGAVNICAPQPVTNKVFMQNLRKAHKIPFGIPINTWMLEVGAVLLQTQTELVLKSRRVIPQRLQQSGFTFGYTAIEDALGSLAVSKQVVFF